VPLGRGARPPGRGGWFPCGPTAAARGPWCPGRVDVAWPMAGWRLRPWWPERRARPMGPAGLTAGTARTQASAAPGMMACSARRASGGLDHGVCGPRHGTPTIGDRRVLMLHDLRSTWLA
jgi:hypothetical protein